MTFGQTAAAMRRLADEIDKIIKEHGDSLASKYKPAMREDQAVGAAIMLCYLRDLLTNAADDIVWDRPRILVMLQTVASDPELFPCGVGTLMWDAEDPEEDEG